MSDRAALNSFAANNLTQKVMVGGALSIVALVAVRLIGVASVAVLGRLLTLADYGVVALAMVAVGLSDAIANRQFEIALVRIPAIEDSHYDTAFTLAACWGLFSAVCLVVAARPLAIVTNEPEVEAALVALSLSPLFGGLASAHFLRFQRDLNQAPGLIVGVAGRLVATVLGVGVGLITRDYWALVTITIAFFAFRAVMTHFWSRRRPRLSLSHWRAFLSFGGWLSAAGAMEFINQKAITMILGARLGVAPSGLYHMGAEVAYMSTSQVIDPLARAVYPALAAVAGERARLRSALRKSQSALLCVALPLGVGVGLTAPEVVRILIGPQWAEATPVAQILAPTAALGSLAMGAQAVMMVHGDTRGVFFRNAIVFAAQTPFLIVGLWAFGLLGAVVARAFAAILQTVLTMDIARKATGEGVIAQAMSGWRSFLACAAMIGAVVLSGVDLDSWPETTVEAAARLAAKAATGAAAYVLAHWALWRAAGAPDGAERAFMDQIARLRSAR